MKSVVFFVASLLIYSSGFSQNVGIGIPSPNAKLSISSYETELAGTAASNLVRTNAGVLGNLAGDEISLASIGFASSNNSSLGIRAYRRIAGTDWTSTSLLIGYDVDNTPRAGGGFLAIGADENIGISTFLPQARLDVNGATRTNSLIITTGGNPSDLLIKNDATGQVGFRKGHVGLGLNYIIAVEGAYPSQAPPQSQGPMIGEIKIFSGNNTPYGWLFCQGQLLLITDYPGLFNIIGTIYGGDGQNNFALPDLRSAVPVGEGTDWFLGEQSN
jgi:microcystin-dependent protein